MLTAPAAKRPMKVLHVGSGFKPMRRGGLVAYIEDLSRAQVADGLDVTYLFSGRHYPVPGGPWLWRRRREGVSMYEIVNSPLYDHGFQPELETSERRTERLFEQVLSEATPDVVHVHELAGLPSSVLDLPRRIGVPTVMTLQDYFALCPSFKLIDSADKVCLRRELGGACVATMASDMRGSELMFEATLRHDLASRRLLRRLRPDFRETIVQWAVAPIRRRGHRNHRNPVDYQRRRDANVERLNRVDLLVAMSNRVADLHEQLGVDHEHIRVQQLTLAHIEHLKLRPPRTGGPVTFATLGGGESKAKGAWLLLEAAASLSDLTAAGRLRLVIFGFVPSDVAQQARRTQGVQLGGTFVPGELDEALDPIDIGIVPSIWEEAYAYAGVEFIAKGIPVIANGIGGMIDYVREGQTGWVNGPCTAEGLASLMRMAVEQPERLATVTARTKALRNEIVLPMAQHVSATTQMYKEVIGR